MRELEVLDPGASATVQDLGRPGFAHLGVPRSGALDQPALRLANRLVGNPEEAAGLEITLSGARLRCADAITVAVTGASCEVRVAGRSMPFGSSVSLPPRAELLVGPAREGLRSYLAVAGGIVTEPVLGSRSTDLLSGLGPAVLTAGDVLPVGARWGSPGGVEAVPLPARRVLRVRLGPRDDWFDDVSVSGLDGSSYVVGAASNRIGLRLEGTALRRRDDEELLSEGMVLGAMQVPPSGQPVIFLADHPVTGGYPVVGVVLAEDLSICAQARPGERLSLRVVA